MNTSVEEYCAVTRQDKSKQKECDADDTEKSTCISLHGFMRAPDIRNVRYTFATWLLDSSNTNDTKGEVNET